MSRQAAAVASVRGRAALRIAAPGLLLALIVSHVPTPIARAAPNQLQNGAASPGSGTTATAFAFSVQYSGSPPTSVSALVGSVLVPLTLQAGIPGEGTYAGSARLPAGMHAVSFEATAQGRDPSLGGPTITVIQAPPPTPAPTPPPTPAATPTPPAPTPRATAVPTPRSTPVPPPPGTARPATPVPATAAPSSESAASMPPGSPGARPSSTSAEPAPTSSGFTGGVVETPSPSPSPSPAPARAAGSAGEGIPPGLLGALAVAGIIVAFAVVRHRRRDRLDPRLTYLPEEARAERAAPQPDAPARRRADWESYALDELPIGTVEYLPPPARDAD